MNRLRVVIVIHGYYPRVGGAERQMQYLASHLHRRGVDLHIITRRYDQNLKSFDHVDGIPVYRLPVPGPKPVASLVFTILSLLKILRLRPHLIHAHEFISPSTVALMADRWMRIPFVVTLHGGGPNGDVQKLKRKSSGKVRLDALKRQARKFIAVSREIEEELNGSGVNTDQIVAITNGVDVDIFSPLSPDERTALRIQNGIPSDALVAIFTGRLVAGKRVHNLVDVWKDVRETYPGAVLLIAGTGPEQETLQSLCVDGARFLGNLDNVVPYLQMSDVFVLPSAAEGLSVAMLEAMACGLPALVTDVGGARQAIIDGVNGWIISPENKEELEDAIKVLFGDADLRSRMGRLGRLRVEETFSIQSAAGQLFDLYHEVAGDVH